MEERRDRHEDPEKKTTEGWCFPPTEGQEEL
jgi:hypothetical protein